MVELKNSHHQGDFWLRWIWDKVGKLVWQISLFWDFVGSKEQFLLWCLELRWQFELAETCKIVGIACLVFGKWLLSLDTKSCCYSSNCHNFYKMYWLFFATSKSTLKSFQESLTFSQTDFKLNMYVLTVCTKGKIHTHKIYIGKQVYIAFIAFPTSLVAKRKSWS